MNVKKKTLVISNLSANRGPVWKSPFRLPSVNTYTKMFVFSFLLKWDPAISILVICIFNEQFIIRLFFHVNKHTSKPW